MTGTPGAGKSSLIDRLCRHLLAADAQITLAVLAVDPSSRNSGGSILGDRTRMRPTGREPRLFFRSQASHLELGGITTATFHALRLLRPLFDLVFVESVGIGQNETDIQPLTDHTCLVMQPLAGDQIQFMKCGIMEIPETFIVNKCDECQLARSSYHLLKGALRQARLIDPDTHAAPPRERIYLTSATEGLGIETLAEHLLNLQPAPDRRNQGEQFFLEKRIRSLWGEFGIRQLHQLNQDTPLQCIDWFEQREQRVHHHIHQLLKDPHANSPLGVPGDEPKTVSTAKLRTPDHD
jgi:LAO/AO transport system kinase